jgi:hypothetical protein
LSDLSLPARAEVKNGEVLPHLKVVLIYKNSDKIDSIGAGFQTFTVVVVPWYSSGV